MSDDDDFPGPRRPRGLHPPVLRGPRTPAARAALDRAEAEYLASLRAGGGSTGGVVIPFRPRA